MQPRGMPRLRFGLNGLLHRDADLPELLQLPEHVLWILVDVLRGLLAVRGDLLRNPVRVLIARWLLLCELLHGRGVHVERFAELHVHGDRDALQRVFHANPVRLEPDLHLVAGDLHRGGEPLQRERDVDCLFGGVRL